MRALPTAAPSAQIDAEISPGKFRTGSSRASAFFMSSTAGAISHLNGRCASEGRKGAAGGEFEIEFVMAGRPAIIDICGPVAGGQRGGEVFCPTSALLNARVMFDST